MSRVRFDAFVLDLATGELRQGTRPIRLQPQPLKVLMLLAGRPRQLVSREEIRRQVWADDTFVDFDGGLNYCIRQIRAALSDDADHPRFIETVPRRGYRFLAAVEPDAAPAERGIMLAVLPFDNLSGDPEQEFFSEGLTEEITAQLGRLSPGRLAVIARTSAMRYKHRDRSIAAIGGELGVSYVIEGSVRRGADRVRVTAQLIQVSDQTHLWADSIERPSGDVLALQSDIAQAIAAGIGVQLAPHERNRLASRRIDSGVYDAYLKGRFFWKRRSRDALDRSVQCFNHAIALDPDYAAAHAGLADVHLTQLDYNYLAPREAFARADRALLDALRLDNTVAEPHASLGHLRLHQFNWAAAEQQFRHAINLNPGYDTAHYYYANLLAALGEFEDALAEATRAVELDPMSPNTRMNRQFVLYLARRYHEAIEEAKETIDMDPGYRSVYYELGRAYERLDDFGSALEAFERARSNTAGRGMTVLAAVAHTLARAGRRREASRMLHELQQLPAGDYISAYELALLHLALGDADAAMRELWKAYADHSSFLPFLNVDARFDELRTDSRFQALVERMNFPSRLSGARTS